MISGEKRWIVSLAVLAVAIISVFAIKVKPLLVQGASLAKDYMHKIDTKQKFLARPEGPPTKMLVKSTGEEGKLLRDTYAAGVQKLNLRKPRVLPEGILQPSIYWLDTLGRTRKELLAQANRSHVDIPRDLSFGDDIPLEKEVPKLLRRLRIVEEIITLAIKSELKSVTEIKPGGKKIIQSSGEPFLESRSNFIRSKIEPFRNTCCVKIGGKNLEC